MRFVLGLFQVIRKTGIAMTLCGFLGPSINLD